MVGPRRIGYRSRRRRTGIGLERIDRCISYRAVDSLAPDVLLVRPYFHYRNRPVSGAAKPFNDERQVEELGRRYVEIAYFVDTSASASREVSLVRLLVRRELVEGRGE